MPIFGKLKMFTDNLEAKVASSRQKVLNHSVEHPFADTFILERGQNTAAD